MHSITDIPEEHKDAYWRGFESSNSTIPYPAGSVAAQAWALGRRDKADAAEFQRVDEQLSLAIPVWAVA